MTDFNNPHVESATGLGNMPSLSSKRARELQRMTQFEEENMTRLVLSKKEERRRLRDEADIALGGGGVQGRGRRTGGFAEEFEDVIRAVGSVGRPGVKTDGYEELRKNGRREGALERGRKRPMDEFNGEATIGSSKKGRFARELKASAKKAARRPR